MRGVVRQIFKEWGEAKFQNSETILIVGAHCLEHASGRQELGIFLPEIRDFKAKFLPQKLNSFL